MSEEESWFRETPEATLQKLNTSEDGLSSEEALQRLSEYGFNELVEEGRIGPFRMFLQQFVNPMVIILLIAIIISIAMVFVHGSHEEEGFIDAIVISVIVIVNAIFGFVQEYRSEQALEALKDLSTPIAVVKRNGERVEIETREIVPGDLVFLEAGDIVPADGRLISAAGLTTDEAALTGESLSVQKSIKEISNISPVLGDMVNLVFQGTIVTTGKGTAIVTSTGMKTEFGKIARLVQESKRELTPLQLDLEDLGRRLGVVVLLLSIIVFAALVFVNALYNWNEALFVAIAVAVAAIPEGLPAIVTVTLAIGVSRMATKNAIVRRLPSVETLGSTTVICSDKTGTITKNEMTVRYIHLSSAKAAVSGTGYMKDGQFFDAPAPASCVALPEMDDAFDTESNNELRVLLKISQLCSNAVLVSDPEDTSNWKIIGDPTEGALLVAAEKAGLNLDRTRSTYKEVAELSFDSKRKRMTIIYRDDSGQVWAFSKGAPEVILDRSTSVLTSHDEIPLSQEQRNHIIDVNTSMANCAMRVLGFAYKKLEDSFREWDEDQVETDMIFVGLVGMIDPPRDGVIESIARSRKAGIRTIMITGDHVLTAKSIAASVGLTSSEADAVTGTQLNDMSDEELDTIVQERDIFARVSPEHKLRIVQSLQRQNHVVAMTGDGVNDAPAIKTADVGISMGIRGAGVTKESSDLILTDDNYSTIVSAIEVGREIYANIRKFVRFLLSANAGEVLLVFFMAMIGLPIPLTPVEILWINLVTDGPPALALGIDPPPEGLMDRCPRKPGTRMLNKGMMRMIIAGGLLATFASGFVYFLALNVGIGWIPGITGPSVDWMLSGNESALEYARTATFATMVLFQLLWVWNCRNEWNPVWKTNIRESRTLFVSVVFSFVLTLMVIYTPLSLAFGTVPLNPETWVVIVGLCLIGPLAPVYKLLGQEEREICSDDVNPPNQSGEVKPITSND